MSLWFIIVLAAIQGLTEFLPVSSSGHLALAPKLLHIADQGVLMDVALHLGTLMAVLLYYRADILRMIMAVLRWKDANRVADRNQAIYIVIATIPAVAGGLLLHTFAPDGIRDVRVIAATTIIFGALLGLADIYGRRDKLIGNIRLRDAFMIGCAQALALIPGTSRSGATITAARTLGYDRVDAARFSFLLGIPAISAAGLMGMLEIYKSGSAEMMHEALIAVALSFVAGLAAITFMMRYLTRFGLWPFAVYRLILGAVLVACIMTGYIG